MLLRWIFLSLAGISCLVVWSIVILTVFSGDKIIYNNDEQVLESQTSSAKATGDLPTTRPAKVVDEEKEKTEDRNYSKEIFRERGIQKGDFAYIAQNGEISIDELLSFFEEGQH